MTDPCAEVVRPAAPVEIVGVSHAYGATTALADVSLAFAAGTATALIGPDGVGKSTPARPRHRRAAAPDQVRILLFLFKN